MIQLQLIATDDRPLGAINWFPVHPTSMNNTNKLVSSDNVGYAAVLFEKTMNKNSMVGKVGQDNLINLKLHKMIIESFAIIIAGCNYDHDKI